MRSQSGRRVHVVMRDPALKNVTSDLMLKSVVVNGREATPFQTAGDNAFDWVRAHTNAALGSLWISFHTHDVDWLGDSVDVQVRLSSGGEDLCAGSAPLISTDSALQLSHVAFRAGGGEAILHVHNGGDEERKLLSVALDGSVLRNASIGVPAGGHVVVAAGVPRKKLAAEVWTAMVETDAGAAGFGGRADVNERFVAGVWPHSDDCPLPGGDDDNAARLKRLGANSVYYDGGNWEDKCGPDPLATVVNRLANDTSEGAFHVLTDPTTASVVDAGALQAVDALFIGDEVDDKTDGDHFRKQLGRAFAALQVEPDTLTFQGSKTSRNVGSFAGIADIQSSDAYNAACAPTMLGVVFPLPVDYPYQYLRNARDNHAPGTFWGYWQLYSEAWSYQPHADEIIMTLGQAVLAGSKGLMSFQSYAKYFDDKAIGAIAPALRSVSAVGNVLREGDVGGVGVTTSARRGEEVLVDVIRSPDQVVVAIVNVNATGYSNLLCHVEILGAHWKFSDLHLSTVDLDLGTAPDVQSLSNWREAVDGELQPLKDVKVNSKGGLVSLAGVRVASAMPLRLFVADVQPRPEAGPLSARVREGANGADVYFHPTQ